MLLKGREGISLPDNQEEEGVLEGPFGPWQRPIRIDKGNPAGGGTKLCDVKLFEFGTCLGDEPPW